MFTYINERSASLNNISKIINCTLIYETRKTSEVEIPADMFESVNKKLLIHPFFYQG